MQTVTTIEGHDARVVDEGDLLAAERTLKWWLVGLIGAILTGALVVGFTYADGQSQLRVNTARIEEVRTEGSLPLRDLVSNIAVIRTQMQANTDRQIEILEQLERMERRSR
jgi:hypothetical protein